tara:strand:- start:871 stop:2007 length:1137 start_codon:yes stop_codon:yes gene_type:complete
MTDNQAALSLSDEEFMKQPPPDFDQVEELAANDTESTDEPVEDVASQEDSEAQEETVAEAEEEVLGQPDGDTRTEPEPFSEGEYTESLDTSSDDSTDTEDDSPETTEFDYESAYKKVTQPFKANGAEMKVTNPDDIVSLMQMGANYQKKMATLKPNLKIVKMLENADLLDESKLNNLIDLSKKDPKAVAKLIEESGIDPLDIDTEAKSNYQPTDYSVTDKEYNLDQVLDEIKDTDTFGRTIDVLTKEWDTNSKSAISDNPEIISVINTHMGNGVFDKVNEVLQQEKVLGKLAGMSDVEAYRQIAEHMASKGLLVQTDNKAESSPVSSETEDNSQANADRKKKRKAVAPVKQAKSQTQKEDNDFLGLSDEEFMKKFASR